MRKIIQQLQQQLYSSRFRKVTVILVSAVLELRSLFVCVASLICPFFRTVIVVEITPMRHYAHSGFNVVSLGDTKAFCQTI